MTNYISNFLLSNKIPTRQGGTRYEKWEGKKNSGARKIFETAPNIPVCPIHRWRSQGTQALNEEVGAPCTLGPQL